MKTRTTRQREEEASDADYPSSQKPDAGLKLEHVWSEQNYVRSQHGKL